MKDGEIVQIGTPEELVLDPATDYVKEFTKDISRAKVLSAQAIMTPLDDATGDAITVPAETKIEDLAPRLIDGDTDAIVIDANEQPVGRVTRKAVIDILIQRV